MLDGLDDIAWSDLSHAYGSADDTPRLLREAGSADGEVVAEALSELHGSIFHQGTVYSATVAAVPFLAELAAGAAHRRAHFLWMLGMLADDRHAYGTGRADVRAAVVARQTSLVALLDDADPRVREAAAYATAKAGVPAEPLWRRWAVEDDPKARATLALALGEVDPAAAEAVLSDAALHGAPSVRVAAAVALLRAGVEWPAGAIPALVAAIDDGAAVTWAWARGGEWVEEIVVAPAATVAVEVARHLLRSGAPRTRRAGLWAAGARCDALRSAPAVFVPLAAPLLHDPDPGVRDSALSLMRGAGAAAGQVADVLAEVAARLPERAAERGFTAEYRAAETLQRLGDPRWVAPVCAAFARGHRVRFLPGGVRGTPRVRDAVRERLVTDPAAAEVLAPMVGHWGTDAEVLAPMVGPRGADAEVLAPMVGPRGADADILLPDLRAALPHAGPQVAEALLMLGHDDPAAVPYWRARAAEAGDLPAALAVHRMTGDITAVLDALRAVLSGDARAPWISMPDLDGFGAALAPLLPAASAHLTGTAEWVQPRRDKQVLAARVVAAVAGPESVLPTVEAVLVAGDQPARHAADLVADLARVSPAAVAHLEPRLRDRLDDRWSRLAAARALFWLGVPAAELAPTLCRGLTDDGGRFALDIIVELNAVETIPDLEELLTRDHRSGVGGTVDDVVWADELLQEHIRRTIAALTGR